jgi:hypothetical protein
MVQEAPLLRMATQPCAWICEEAKSMIVATKSSDFIKNFLIGW